MPVYEEERSRLKCRQFEQIVLKVRDGPFKCWTGGGVVPFFISTTKPDRWPKILSWTKLMFFFSSEKNQLPHNLNIEAAWIQNPKLRPTCKWNISTILWWNVIWRIKTRWPPHVWSSSDRHSWMSHSKPCFSCVLIWTDSIWSVWMCARSQIIDSFKCFFFFWTA